MAKKSTTAIALNAANYDQMTVAQARKQLQPSDLPYLQELQRLSHERVIREIWTYWEIGEVMSRAYKSAKDETGESGASRIARLAAANGMNDKRYLRNALTVVERWGNRDEYSFFAELTSDTGNNLSIAHIDELSRIRHDDKLARKLGAQALEKGWTHKDLKRHINNMFGQAKGPRRGSGRPLRIPTTPIQCTSMMIQTLKPLPRLFNEAWFNDEKFHLNSATREILEDSEVIDVELAQNIHELADLLQKLEPVLIHARTIVSGLLPGVDSFIDAGKVQRPDINVAQSRIKGLNDGEEEEIDEDADEEVEVGEINEDDFDDEADEEEDEEDDFDDEADEEEDEKSEETSLGDLRRQRLAAARAMARKRRKSSS